MPPDHRRSDEQDRGVRLQCAVSLKNLTDVEQFITTHSQGEDVVVAIDAPLIITNKKGQRPCERAISERFGSAHASAHSSNLLQYPNPTSVQLAKWMVGQKFGHCPDAHELQEPPLHGRWFFEVYPHPAHVVLFGRQRIIKYKKGRTRTRRNGLTKMRVAMQRYLARLEPSFQRESFASIVAENVNLLRGRSLKYFEDRVDAVFCAYLAAYFWRWGYSCNEMIGDKCGGYIINPLPSARRE
jgi:predicted RNase H-like nuclease